MLNDLAREIHEVSTSKGFDPPSEANIDRKLLLVVTEIAEAHNEFRAGIPLDKIYFDTASFNSLDKPEGFPIEIADTIIRLLHIGYSLGIDMDAAVRMKIEYNKTRPYKHGKKF